LRRSFEGEQLTNLSADGALLSTSLGRPLCNLDPLLHSLLFALIADSAHDVSAVTFITLASSLSTRLLFPSATFCAIVSAEIPFFSRNRIADAPPFAAADQDAKCCPNEETLRAVTSDKFTILESAARSVDAAQIADALRFVLQNILAGRYFVPAGVSLSSDCKDLLARIFVVDPKRRITVPEIRAHPWFVRDLPRKLAMPYKPSENALLRAQAQRVIETLRVKRAEQMREATKSYIV
jgi:serine/threonine protein kinase